MNVQSQTDSRLLSFPHFIANLSHSRYVCRIADKDPDLRRAVLHGQLFERSLELIRKGVERQEKDQGKRARLIEEQAFEYESSDEEDEDELSDGDNGELSDRDDNELNNITFGEAEV